MGNSLKMSKTSRKKVAVPSTSSTSNNTPQRSTRSTPAKTPGKQQKTDKTPKRVGAQKNARRSPSDDESDDDNENSFRNGDGSTSGASSNGARIDFLSVRPRDHVSDDEDVEDEEGEVTFEEGVEEEEEEEEEEENQEDNESRATTDDASTTQQTSRRQSRKQSKPKKRKDRVTKDIIKYQSTTKLLVPRLPFQRIVREVMQQFKNDFRLQTQALECLQESSEDYLVQLFEDANLACYHRSRVTLADKDMRLVQLVRGSNDPGRKQARPLRGIPVTLLVK